MQSINKRREQSERYRWNVAVLQQRNGEVYEATLACRSRLIFRRRYHLETAAALAADLGKTLLHGESAVGRLNFPGDRNIQQLAIDFTRAENTMREDLREQGHSEETVQQLTQEMLKAIAYDVLDSVRDALGCGKVQETEASLCESRVRFLEEAMEIDADVPYSRIVGGRAVDIRCGLSSTAAMPQTVKLGREGRQSDAVGSLGGHLCGTATEDRQENGDSDSSAEDESKSTAVEECSDKDMSSENLKGVDSCAGSVVAKSDGRAEADVSFNAASWMSKESCSRQGDGVLSKEAAELLLALTDSRPEQMALATSCTLKNVRFLYLTQSSLYRLMNLQHVMAAEGLNLSALGICLLRGVMVMVSQREMWKLRRIVSWDCKSMQLMLEDDSVITPLQISNEPLEEGSSSSYYVLAELNHFMEHCSHGPIAFDELVAVYYRLCCCGQGIIRLRRENDAAKVLQDLVQKLVNAPGAEFLREFWKFVDPMSFSLRSRESEKHIHTTCVLGDDLKDVFQSWLETPSDEAEMDLEAAMLKCAAELQPSEDPMQSAFSYEAVAPRDPRTVLSRRRARTKTTSDSTEAYRAPRKRKPLSRDRALTIEPRLAGVEQNEQRTETKNSREQPQPQSFPHLDLQNTDVCTDSLTYIERTLRRIRRDLCNGVDSI